MKICISHFIHSYCPFLYFWNGFVFCWGGHPVKSSLKPLTEFAHHLLHWRRKAKRRRGAGFPPPLSLALSHIQYPHSIFIFISFEQSIPYSIFTHHTDWLAVSQVPLRQCKEEWTSNVFIFIFFFYSLVVCWPNIVIIIIAIIIITLYWYSSFQ